MYHPGLRVFIHGAFKEQLSQFQKLINGANRQLKLHTGLSHAVKNNMETMLMQMFLI